MERTNKGRKTQNNSMCDNSNYFLIEEGNSIYQSVGHIPNSLSYLFAILLSCYYYYYYYYY